MTHALPNGGACPASTPTGPDAGGTLLLSDCDIRALLSVPDCIPVMEHALREVSRGTSTLPLRTVMRLGDTPNAFATMPAVHGTGDAGSIGAKIITVFPGNDATPFDSHIGVVLLFDSSNGALLAIADASSITAIRTAAVSGLATRVLANADASTLAVIGAGVLAIPHVEAVHAVREIERVRIWSRSSTRANAVRDQLAAMPSMAQLEILVSPSPEHAVREADVVCTITSARTPVLHGAWLQQGTHVNAVGASLATARELDTAAVQMSRLYVDRRESALAEAGDFLIPRAEGALDDSHIVGELGAVLEGHAQGRQARSDITLFKSLGLAVEDIAALRFVYDRALVAGIGARVALGGLRAHS